MIVDHLDLDHSDNTSTYHKVGAALIVRMIRIICKLDAKQYNSKDLMHCKTANKN